METMVSVNSRRKLPPPIVIVTAITVTNLSESGIFVVIDVDAAKSKAL